MQIQQANYAPVSGLSGISARASSAVGPTQAQPIRDSLALSSSARTAAAPAAAPSLASRILGGLGGFFSGLGHDLGIGVSWVEGLWHHRDDYVPLPTSPLSYKRQTTGAPDRFIVMGGNINAANRLNGDAASRHLTGADDFAVTTDVSSMPHDVGQAATTASYASLAQFKQDLAAGKIPSNVKWVMYDIEGWDATPQAEKQDPAAAMKEFCELAHAHGLKVVTIPYPNLAENLGLKPGESMYNAFHRYNLAGAAAKYADVVAIQAQQLELEPKKYRNFVAATAAQARAANPNVTFLSELTGTPQGKIPTPAQLNAAYQSVSDIADGFYLSMSAKHRGAQQAVSQFLSQLPAS
jgi:hypothetical protein